MESPRNRNKFIAKMKIPSQKNNTPIEYASAMNPNNGAKIITTTDLNNASTLKIVAL